MCLGLSCFKSAVVTLLAVLLRIRPTAFEALLHAPHTVLTLIALKRTRISLATTIDMTSHTKPRDGNTKRISVNSLLSPTPDSKAQEVSESGTRKTMDVATRKRGHDSDQGAPRAPRPSYTEEQKFCMCHLPSYEMPFQGLRDHINTTAINSHVALRCSADR